MALDFTGDGNLDLVLADLGPSGAQLQVVAGDGHGGLTGGGTIPISGQTDTWLETGDLDGDGFLDLMAFNFPYVMIFASPGSGSYVLDHTAVIELGLGGAALADMDGDGRLDLVAGQVLSGVEGVPGGWYIDVVPSSCF